MRIFSGKVCMGYCGTPTHEFDELGNELFVGDIVKLYHGQFIGTDDETWHPSGGLTAIVSNKYVTYGDGSIEVITETPKAFTMGIFNTGVQGKEWKVELIKSHRDIVPGEHMVFYGFNWRE